MSSTKGYRIESPGDPSVGWFPSTWIIQGEFYFDGDEDKEVFEKELLSVFHEYIADDAYLITVEDFDKTNKKHEQDYKIEGI